MGKGAAFSAIPVFLLNYLLYDFVRCDDNAPLATFGFSAGCSILISCFLYLNINLI